MNTFTPTDACFSDVPAYDWSSRFICYAADHQIIQGYPDGQFRPWQRVTYAEALKMVFNTIQSNPVPVTEPWYVSFVDFANSNNLNATNPSLFGPISRGQMAELLSNTVQFNERQLAYDDSPRKRHRHRSYSTDVTEDVSVAETVNDGLSTSGPDTGSGAVLDVDQELYAPNGYYTLS